MGLAMMGCGTGAVLEPEYINQLPKIRNRLQITLQGEIGLTPSDRRRQETEVTYDGDRVLMNVGDSRIGWVQSYQTLLELSTDPRFDSGVEVIVDLCDIRPAGEPLKGFGGVANPVKLTDLYQRVALILNKANGRQLNSVECCLLIDEAASTIVAGNIRRSAGMRQGASDDELFANAKMNLWQQDEAGNWRIDPERDALRMSNHTRVFHHKPTLTECIDAVRQQYYSGEGAIQWAGEAVARASCDLMPTRESKQDFLKAYNEGQGKQWIGDRYPEISKTELEHRLSRVGLNPCHSGDTLVSTNRGLVPIQELVNTPFQALVDLRSVGLSGVKLTDAIAFSTGVQTTYRVTLANGMEMRCTAEHQHLTNQGWVATKDLKLDHAILTQKGEGSFGKATITVEQAQMLGWLYGDGSIYKQARGLEAVFYMNPQEYPTVFPVMSEAVESLTGYNHQPSLVKGLYTFHSGSPLMSGFLEQLGIESKEFLPTGFFTQSKDVIVGFLQGLFSADACVSVKARHIELRNRSKHLLQAVQLLLLNLGIKSSVKIKEKPGGKGVPYTLKDGTEKVSNNRGSWRLIIYSGEGMRKFRETIGFTLVPAKQKKLEHLADKKLSRTYSETVVSSWYSAKVTGVEEFGEEPVYDLHVPLTHSFIANGCITHNCGEIIGADFHCVSGDTMLVTRDGMHPIRSLVGQSVEIWNGQRWSRVTPMLTGRDRQLYRVSFADGTWLDVTEKHRFFVSDRFGKTYLEMTTAQLQEHLSTHKYALHTEPFQIDYQDGKFVDPLWAYTLGQLVGDGSLCQSNGKPQLQLRLYGAKSYPELALAGRTSGKLRYYAENPETPGLLYTGFPDQFDPEQVRDLKANAKPLESVASWNREGILNFIAGLIDADGSVTSSGGVRLYLSDYDRAYRVYLLLLKCGIRSSVNLQSRAGESTNFGIRSKDLWYLQITDCAAIPCQRVNTSGGHHPTNKGKWQIIREIVPIQGQHDTFCFNEPEFHKGVFGGTLTGQCNLAEIHLNLIDPKNDREQEDAFAAGALSVATLLNHKFVEPRYQYSREIDPIVGVSFTGLFDFFVHAFGVDWLRWWVEGRPATPEGIEFKRQEAAYMTRWRDIVHAKVWDYCDRHGLRRPNRCTTVQPSGCLDKNAVRIFDQGLLYADELVAPGSGETVSLPLSVRGGIGATTAIANQPLNLVRVTLANGRIIRMTPNHRLSIAGQWVRADHLQVGMNIDHSLGEYHKSEDALLVPLDLNLYSREERSRTVGHNRGVLTRTISTPVTLNPELGYFLGCLYGDGAMSETKYRVRFSFNPNEYDLVERLQKIGENCFGLKGNVNWDLNSELKGDLTFASKQLFDWLKINGLAKTTSVALDRIPQAVRRSSRETILSFFCGLIDTDGCVRERGSLSIDSASPKFIRNLQQIGEAVGLSFSIFHNTQGSNLQSSKNMWGLCLSRMTSQAESLEYLNTHSRKCALRPLPTPKRYFAFHPYQVSSIEFETGTDYSYDFAIEGVNDDDSWYWQGALKSHNTKSLLTGASPGWHPPKAQRFIRRITFGKNDPVALACIDYGYNVIPSQSDKDEKGNLLNDPFDPRCSEWLVEIPIAVSWADLPGADEIDISQFSALAQMDFYMNVQSHYVTHNTSATVEVRESEIELLGNRIYEAIQNDEGYISAALLARFDDRQSFPRLPFEPIDKAEYDRLSAEVLVRRKTDDFKNALQRYDLGELAEAGPAGCDSDKCLLPEKNPS